jgi:nucleoside-diphosphate-sugar epimerase
MTYTIKRHVRNCSVIVIGGAGFLGSHLVDYLCDHRGCEVLVLDNFVSGQLKHIHHEASWQHFDLNKDVSGLGRICKSHGAKFVFNYAAQPYIPKCYDNPELYLSTNGASVLAMLEHCHGAGVQGVLQVSSAEIYGSCQGRITEKDYVEPHSTYGVSKALADGLVQVRWREAGVPAIAMRQFNCVGERETHEYVIPEIISQLALQGGKAGRATIRLGNNSTRDFQYAGDAVRMAVSLMEHGEFGEVYNMGSEECHKIYDVANLIADLMGHPSPVIEPDPARVRKWEIWHLQSNNSKLYATIPERPATSFRDALKATISYYHSNGNKWDW